MSSRAPATRSSVLSGSLQTVSPPMCCCCVCRINTLRQHQIVHEAAVMQALDDITENASIHVRSIMASRQMMAALPAQAVDKRQSAVAAACHVVVPAGLHLCATGESS